jgi:uncharacterized protein YuzE
MDALKLMEGRASGRSHLDWDYDDEAEVLYLSIWPTRPALGLDVGDGTILRYDESTREVVGFTLIGLRTRLTEELDRAISSSES